MPIAVYFTLKHATQLNRLAKHEFAPQLTIRQQNQVLALPGWHCQAGRVVPRHSCMLASMGNAMQLDIIMKQRLHTQTDSPMLHSIAQAVGAATVQTASSHPTRLSAATVISCR